MVKNNRNKKTNKPTVVNIRRRSQAAHSWVGPLWLTIIILGLFVAISLGTPGGASTAALAIGLAGVLGVIVSLLLPMFLKTEPPFQEIVRLFREVMSVLVETANAAVFRFVKALLGKRKPDPLFVKLMEALLRRGKTPANLLEKLVKAFRGKGKTPSFSTRRVRRVKAPPGLRHLHLAQILFSAKTVSLTFKPLIADWQYEYFEALKNNKPTWQLRLISVRYYWYYAKAFGLSKIGRLFKALATRSSN